MRGTYEAFILVKVKDGREFVCALNRQKKTKNSAASIQNKEVDTYLENSVIWN